MATYKGKPVVIARPVDALYNRFSDMSALEEAIRNNAGDSSQMGEVKIDSNSLSIVNPQVGEIKFEITERVEPEKVVFTAVNSPLPIAMSINLKAVDESSTEVSTNIDLEIPAVMRAFVGPKLQKVADKFGEMMSQMGK